MFTTANLFPIPVSQGFLPAIPADVIQHAKDLEFIPWHSEINYHLSISKNRQVLDDQVMHQLRDHILDAANTYFHDVIGADESIGLRIKHSWVTRHKTGEFNPAHNHSSSVITATVYLEAPDNSGDLIFTKDPNYLNLFPLAVDVDFQQENLINAKKFAVTPKPNMIVCFPSHLNHKTSVNNSNGERYALNTDFWVTGVSKKKSSGFESEF